MEKKGGASKTKKKILSKHDQEKLNAQIAEAEKPKAYNITEIDQMKDRPLFTLGDGNFAFVYKGSHQGKPLAIKEYKPGSHYLYYKAEKTFFIREGDNKGANYLPPLRDKRIIKLLGYCDDGTGRLLFEYAPKVLKTSMKDLDWETSLKILQQIAEALSLVHGQSQVYCDLKPENVLLTEDDDIKLIDFNGVQEVGKISQVGTAGYNAPEMSKNVKLSPATDVYSLGVLMLQLLMKHDTVGTRGKKGPELHIVDRAMPLRKKQYGVVDDRLVLNDARFKDKAMTATNLAMQCVEHNVTKRPTMKKVAETLGSLRQ